MRRVRRSMEAAIPGIHPTHAIFDGAAVWRDQTIVGPLLRVKCDPSTNDKAAARPGKTHSSKSTDIQKMTAIGKYFGPAAAVFALLLAILSVLKLEQFRAEVTRIDFTAGSTPATLYTGVDKTGPLVVIAHGFAGSRQLMDAYALTLARAGYQVAAFDFEGHGRNPVAMSGDVTSIDGTTRRLVAETQRVTRAALKQTGWTGPVALVGHSMASDIIIRAAQDNDRIGPVVAISMFSQAITSEAPRALLAISGQWEPHLREEALRAVRQIDPAATEGQTVQDGDVLRRAVVAPLVEHVGVLYSETALKETRAWLDAAYSRAPSQQGVATIGPWIVLLVASLVVLAQRGFSSLPVSVQTPPVPRRRFFLGLVIAPVLTPLLAVQVDLDILPVLVADYLALHLLVYGMIQFAILWASGVRPGPFRPLPTAALLFVCICVIGFVLDRYVASFMPSGTRLSVFAAVAIGAVPFMLADTMMSAAGHASMGRRLLLRIGFLVSLGIAVALDFERLMFLLIILPVIVLYFAVFGQIARPVALRSGSTAAGFALGLVLAWSIAAAFPIFAR